MLIGIVYGFVRAYCGCNVRSYIEESTEDEEAGTRDEKEERCALLWRHRYGDNGLS